MKTTLELFVAKVTPANFASLLYHADRHGFDEAVTFVARSLRANQALLKHPAFIAWADVNQHRGSSIAQWLAAYTGAGVR